MNSFRDSALARFLLPYDLTIDPRTGAARVTIPLRVSPGRAEFQPELALTYSSGARNSPFGFGWTLSGVDSIAVDTRRSIPTYEEGRDGYVHEGDELVAYRRVAVNGWERVVDIRGDHRVERFRSRIEQSFQRFERWVHRPTGRVHWRGFDPDGTVSIFGVAGDGTTRIADPADPDQRTFEWLIEAQYDPSGNAIRYEYKSEDDAGVDRTLAYEAARLRDGRSFAQRYLKRILYGNTIPLSPGTPHDPQNRWRFEVVFDYGEHSAAAIPSHAEGRRWFVRADPFFSCHAGFDIRTRRLCRRVLMFHHFPLEGVPRLVGATELSHAEDPAGAILERVTWRGYRTNIATGVIDDRAVPPVEFRYSDARPDAAFSPAAATENLPIGIDGRRHQWADLRGEGLPGILTTQAEAWYFKENLGGGRFGPLERVDEAPARPSGGFALHDFDGDGNVDLVGFEGREAGFFTRERASGRWEGFQAFSNLPRVDFANARVQWIDLNGDGHPDLVVDLDDRLAWYASEGAQGFAAAVELAKPERRSGGVPAVAQDGRVHTFFADMNGDGRADLVDVDDGRIEYWPNLGHGRFGPGVTMENAPAIAAFNRLDADRLRLIDLDGSGTADLVYLGEGEIRLWTNESGNRFSAPRQLAGLPYIDDLASAQVLDFFADGTACLVWSTPLPGREERAVHTLRLSGALPPRLLLSVSNGAGRTTALAYRSSARDYLHDKANGRPWTVPLPHHQAVVARTEATDHIGGGRLATWFEYHDGVWDDDLRRFGGFGFTDTYDADAIMPGGAMPPEEVSPPSVVRRWYYTGDATGTDAARVREQYAGDALAMHLPPPEIEDIAHHTTEEQIESLRAIAGLPWREELYEVLPDGSRASHPLRITETTYLIRRLHPGDTAEEAVFAPIPVETLRCEYEGSAGDPRIVHDVLLDIDADGQATRRVSLAYARRLAPGVVPEQQRLLAMHASVRFTRVDEAARYETGILVESQRHVLTGLAPVAPGAFTRGALLTQVDDALAHPLGVYAPAAHNTPEARLVQWERTYFWNATRTAALPLGAVGPVTLPHHSERACLPDADLNTAFDGKVTAALIASDGRYRLADGYWWAEESTTRYADAAGFQVAVGESTPGTGDRTLTHDADFLFVVAIEEPFGNIVRTVVDLQSLGAARVTDPNGNMTEALYDALGMPFAAADGGTQRGRDGAVHPVGEDGLAAWAPPAAITAAAILADPAAMLQGATRLLFHDFGAFARGDGPPLSITLERERHVHDGDGTAPAGSFVRVTIEYFDGFGRAIQTKTTAGPGLAIERDGAGQIVLNADGTPALAQAAARWQASGHDVFDQKGWLVRQHEPFFTTTSAFEDDATLRALGASTRMRFDALGRLVREDLPDGTVTATTYTAWFTRESDANDNVAGSAWEAARQARPVGDPERRALDQAQAHAATPTIVEMDPIGRACRRHEMGGGGVDRVTVTEYGAFDGPLRVIDPRGLTAFTYRYDLLGRAVFEHGVDSGDRWTLFDSGDRPVHRWDGRNVHTAFRHDAGGRLVEVAVEEAPGAARVVEQIVYGDDPLVADAQERNARGRVIEHRDEAGRVRIDRYDLKGQPLDVRRAVRDDYQTPADWSGPAPALSAAHRTTISIDALGRTLSQTCADGTTREYTWASYGHLGEIRLSTADGVLDRVVLANAIAHNARGQRASLRLGNGVDLAWEYDPRTFRLRRLAAARAGAQPRTYLDVSYTYDPVGNITHMLDNVQDPGSAAPLLQGLTVSPACDFTYDAFYRLRTASGRVHQALVAADDPGSGVSLKGTQHITLANGAAVERYTRTYQYDLSGNLRSVRHAGQTQNWTTNLWISPTSNRTLPDDGNPIAAPETWFDAAGNNIRLPHLREMVWNHGNRLTRATIIDRSAAGEPSDAEYYTYGADGRRVRRVTERLVNGQLEVVETVYMEGCEIRRVTLGGALRLARTTSFVDDGPARLATLHQWTVDIANVETASINDKKLHYLLGNHLGSVTLELDENGDVLTYEEYFPYGGTSFMAGDDLRDVRLKDTRYAGRLRDDATGFYHFDFREYAPWIGRWMSPDPAGPADGPNLYLYVHANPVRFIDPNGLQTDDRQVHPSITHELPDGIRVQLEASPDLAAQFDRGEVFFLPQEDGSFTAITRADAEAFVRAENAAGRTPNLSLYTEGQPEPDPDPTEEQVEEIMRSLEEALAPLRDLQLPDLADLGTGGRGDAGLNAQDGDGDAEAGTAQTADGSSGSGNTQDGQTGESGAGGNATTGTGPGSGNAGVSGGAAGAVGGGNGTSRTGAGSGAGGAGAGAGAGTGQRTGGGGGTRGRTGDADRPGREGGVEGGVEGGRPGGTTDPPPVPPGYLIGPDGIPYSPDLPPPSTQTGTGTPVTDPSQVRQGVAGGTDDRGEPGSDRSGGTRPGGVEGGREGGADTREGQREGGSGDRPGSGEPETALDTATRWAGYLNFVFDNDGEGGERGGIPGGLGLLGLSGRFFQVLYIIATVVSTFFMVKTIIQSVAGGALRAGLRSLLNLIRNPGNILRGVWTAGRGFVDDAARAVGWLRRSLRGGTGRVRPWHAVTRLVRDARQWATIQRWRNSSFWYRPRWFGQSPHYNWEHTVTQAFGRRFPGLQPYVNSYLNTWLRIPMRTNSWLGNNLARKATFYAGAIEGNIRSWRLGQWIGGQAADEIYREPDYAAAQ